MTGDGLAKGASYSITSYAYDSAGRLSTVTDALKQVQVLNYDPDNEVTQRVFENTVSATQSPTYSYDPYFPRLIQASGTSGTIPEHFKYYPPGVLGALQMSSEQEGTNGTVAYTYDAIGRPANRTVGGSAESWTYETSTGQMRVHTHTDALGTFTLGYLGATNQLESQSTGTLSTSWTYDTNTNDRRLTGVSTTPGGTSYGLTSTPEAEITDLTDSYNSATFTNGYDPLLRLTTVTPATGSGYSFTPDPAGNITSITRPQGTGTVTIPINPNTVNEVATANNKSFSYAANGVLLADYGRTYHWDGAYRLLSIAMGASNPAVSFSYDALGRRVTSTVTPAGGSAVVTSHVWCGQILCASSASGSTRRYLAEGELSTVNGVTTPYYYGPDQLGSVRDVLNASTGAHLAHYDYDAYGLTPGVAYGTVTGTPQPTDFGYAGMVYEPTSGLSLANYRSYDPQTARWQSRDPIGELGGINLYQYSNDTPLNNSDPLGLCSKSHNYQIGGPTLCSPNDAFWMVTQPDASAPAAPGAQDGFTPRINLAGNNPISQDVNPYTQTITNTTLPGHIFYYGQVVIQVTPGPNGGSYVQFTGTGNGPNPLLNEFVGYTYFGSIYARMVMECGEMASGQ